MAASLILQVLSLGDCNFKGLLTVLSTGVLYVRGRLERGGRLTEGGPVEEQTVEGLLTVRRLAVANFCTLDEWCGASAQVVTIMNE